MADNDNLQTKDQVTENNLDNECSSSEDSSWHSDSEEFIENNQQSEEQKEQNNICVESSKKSSCPIQEMVDNSQQSEKDNVEECSSEKNPAENNLGYPTPFDLQQLTKATFSVNYVKKVMKGPICWKCYDWVTFFTCKNCNKSFHRECALMGPGFPYPIFDKSINDAMMSNWGEVKMLKCSVCITSDETRLVQMKSISVELLNLKFCQIAKIIEAKSETFHFKSSVSKILEKARNNEYKTTEGFFADFKMIRYTAIATLGNAEEIEEVEETKLIAEEVVKRLELAMKYCWECDTRRYDENGNFLSKKKYTTVNQLTCQVPHPVLWMKEPTYPFWPTKILGFKDKYIQVQSFGEKASPRSLLFQKDVKFRTYSKQKPSETKSTNRDWSAAVSNCNAYLDGMKAKFGEAGVVVPGKSEEFDGDVAAIIKKMYPSYNGN